MTEIKQSAKIDGRIWRCPVHKSEKKSIRQQSFVEKSHLKLDDFILLTYLWAGNCTVKIAVEFTGLSKQTVVDWFNFYRDVCVWRMGLNLPVVGGVGHVVQIDESVVSRAKYNRGRRVAERWIFGGFDTLTKEGFLMEVPDRSANTLLPLIQRHILPGTEIHSDRWAAYNRIDQIPVQPPFVHLTVNHSENFVDPTTGACTNGVEGMWMRAKRKIKAVNGSSRDLLPGYLEEFLWRERNESSGRAAFESILTHIAEWYCENKEDIPVS